MQANKLVIRALVQNTQSKGVVIMNSIMISLIVLACVVGSALMGLLLGAILPPQYLSDNSKDMVRLGIGLIATMTAVLLGLLIASAKSFYDTQNNELTEMSAKVVLLDRILAHYGPEAKEVRELLQGAVTAFSIRCGRKGVDKIRKRNQRQAEPKFYIKRFKDSRQRTTHNTHCRLRR
jgi:hypothetical protein